MVDVLIRRELAFLEPIRVLDVGVGSGNQLLLYASTGALVSGVDISKKMLRVAQYKINQKGLSVASVAASGQALPFGDEVFDLVTCCGSVLNYCDDYKATLSEMCRVLRLRGTMLVGFDNSESPDSMYAMLDVLTNHSLRFCSTVGAALRRFSKSPPATPYPYVTSDGEFHYVREKFIGLGNITSCVEPRRVKLERFYGVHTLSGLVPFTLASNPKTRVWIKHLTRHLEEYDSTLWGFGGINRFAYHVLAVAVKH